MANLPYKYKTIFDNPLIASSEIFDKPLNISSASLEKLKPLIPDSIDLDKNIDLLGVAFNAAIVNKFNKNGDGIDAQNALIIKDYFIHKPTNIEHDRQNIVGHIVSAAFSDYETNDILSNEAALKKSSPFNIALSAVVYRSVNPDFVELLETAGDPENDFYQKISTSWEIGFNDYSIAIGNGDELDDLEVIEDIDDIEILSKHLKANGGTGEDDAGRKIHRLITGEIFPLGIGFTTNPAADVQGVAVHQNYYPKETSEIYEDESALRSSPRALKNISQKQNLNVIENTGEKIMDTDKTIIQQLEEFLGDKVSNKKFSEEAVATVTKIVNDAILEKNKHFLEEKEKIESRNSELETIQAEMEEKAKKTGEEIEGLKSALDSTSTKLGEIESNQRAQEAAARFDVRMDAINDSYELSAEDSSIIAQELKELDEADETFATYQDRLSVVWKEKNKEVLAAKEEELQKRIEEEVQKRIESLSAESVKEEVSVADVSEEENQEVVVEEIPVSEISEDALVNAEAETTDSISNNNGASSEQERTLRDKFKQAFHKENITIKY